MIWSGSFASKALSKICLGKKARILMDEMKLVIEEELKKNNELTSNAIYSSLRRKWPDLTVSTSMIKCVRREMGWVCTRPQYRQLLHEVCAVKKQKVH